MINKQPNIYVDVCERCGKFDSDDMIMLYCNNHDLYHCHSCPCPQCEYEEDNGPDPDPEY